MKRTSLALGVAVGIALLGLSVVADAQDYQAEHLLDDVSLRFFYQSGWGLKMSFASGRVSYEWIAGPPKGNGTVGVPYRSRKIGERQYLVTFRDRDQRGDDFVVLVLDFEDNTMAGSALLDYATDRERLHFEGGIIEGVRWKTRRPASR
jgi:hypothetical protein